MTQALEQKVPDNAGALMLLGLAEVSHTGICAIARGSEEM